MIRILLRPLLYGTIGIISTIAAMATPVNPAESQGRVDGELLPGWRENSAWAKAWIHYSVQKDEAGEFQRAEVKKRESGYCQFDFRLPADFTPGTYRLSFGVRMKGRGRLNTGIRMVDAPFRWLCRSSVSPGGEWTKFEKVFTLTELPKKEAISIFMQFDGAATLDLRDVALTPFRRTESGHPVNLFRQGSLSLGLPAGWSWHNCFSDGDQVVFSGDPKESGPSGMPPLEIDVRSGVMTSYDYRDAVTVYSAPLLPPPPDTPLVAGMMLKGDASGELLVRCDSRVLARTKFLLREADGWKRVDAAFTADRTGTYTVELTFTGVLRCDAPYAGIPQERERLPASGWTELAPGRGDAAGSGIVFDDETGSVLVRAKPAPGAAAIELSAVNLYGERIGVRRRLESGVLEIPLDFLKGRAYGPWRLEAVQLDSVGSPIDLPAAERVVNRLPRPVNWGKDAPDSPFGIHVQPVNRHLTMAKAIGANWVRLHDAGVQLLGWAYLEREPGKWTFDDEGVERYRRHHLKLLGELTTAPTFRSNAPGSSAPPPTLAQSVTAPYFLPTSQDEYREYCERILKRYGGKIDAFDVWNEPWLPLFFHTDFVKTLPAGAKRWASFGGGFYLSPDDPAAKFFELQRAVESAVKNTGVKARVLGVNTSDGLGHEGRVPGAEFSRRMSELGAAEHCDAIAYHQYLTGVVGFPGDDVEKGYDRAIGPIAAHHGGQPPRPVWLTEGSPWNDPCDGFYRSFPEGAAPQEVFDAGDRIVRFVTALLGRGVEKVFLYSMGIHNGYGTKNPNRLLVTAAGELHPAAGAYATLTSRLEGLRFVRRITVGKAVSAYLFSDGKTSCAVLLPDPNVAGAAWTPTPSTRWEAADLFGNPYRSDSPYASYIRGRGAVQELETYLMKGE